jgi:hypothetical protein
VGAVAGDKNALGGRAQVNQGAPFRFGQGNKGIGGAVELEIMAVGPAHPAGVMVGGQHKGDIPLPGGLQRGKGQRLAANAGVVN